MRNVLSRFLPSNFFARRPIQGSPILGAAVLVTAMAGLFGLYRAGCFFFSHPAAEPGPFSTASVTDESQFLRRLAELPGDDAGIPQSAVEIREEMDRLAGWLLRWYPNAADAGIIAGRLEYHLGSMDAAEDAFRGVLRLDPENVHAHHGLALIDVARSRFEQAVLHFQRVIARSPGAIGPMLELADALIRTGRIDEAVDLLEKDFPSEIESVWRFQMLGQCYLHRGDLRRARIMYELALLLEPEDAVALTGLATVSSRLKDGDQAAAFTERLRRVREREREAGRETRKIHDDAAALAQKLAEGYATAGRLCAVHGDDRSAERLWRRAVALRPDWWEAHRDLAEWYLKRPDRVSEAVAHAEAAVAASPNGATHFLLARAYRAAGRSRESLDAVRKALAGGERRAEAMALYRRLTEGCEQTAADHHFSELPSGTSQRP